MSQDDFIPAGWILSPEAENVTGYTPDHLRRLARAGEVAARKMGRVWVFERSSLERHKAEARRGRRGKRKE